MTPHEIERYTQTNGHCSALVKLTGDFQDLFMSHSSWFRYQAMTRIMKHCELGAARGLDVGIAPASMLTPRPCWPCPHRQPPWRPEHCKEDHLFQLPGVSLKSSADTSRTSSGARGYCVSACSTACRCSCRQGATDPTLISIHSHFLSATSSRSTTST